MNIRAFELLHQAVALAKWPTPDLKEATEKLITELDDELNDEGYGDEVETGGTVEAASGELERLMNETDVSENDNDNNEEVKVV